MIQILCLNGPPQAGKDTGACILNQLGFYNVKLSQPLKDGLAAIFFLDEGEVLAFEADKEIKRERLGGMSWREAQIWLSEEVMKPKFGKDIFADILVKRIQQMGAGKYVISDCGFQNEFTVLKKTFEHVQVVQIDRAGCSFEDDSREWVHMGFGVPTPRIANNANIHSYAMLLKRFVSNLGWGIKVEPES